jgi:hypothetical protein
MHQAFFQAEIAEKLDATVGGLAVRQPADHLRQDHVFQRRKFRQQMMKLINKSNFGAPDAGALKVGKMRCRDCIDIDFAGIRMFEQPGNMQQRRFTRT